MVNKGTETLSTVLQTQFSNTLKQWIKQYVCHDQVEFVLGIQGWFNIHKISKQNTTHKWNKAHHIIISIDEEKDSEDSTSLHVKGAEEPRDWRIILQYIGDYIDNVILNGKNRKHFLPKIRNETRVSTFPFLFNIVL
jgi:hypothetical protein